MTLITPSTRSISCAWYWIWFFRNLTSWLYFIFRLFTFLVWLVSSLISEPPSQFRVSFNATFLVTVRFSLSFVCLALRLWIFCPICFTFCSFCCRMRALNYSRSSHKLHCVTLTTRNYSITQYMHTNLPQLLTRTVGCGVQGVTLSDESLSDSSINLRRCKASLVGQSAGLPFSRSPVQFRQNPQKSKTEHIEVPAKPLDYFLRSNESNINQYVWHASLLYVTWLIYVCDMTHLQVRFDSFLFFNRMHQEALLEAWQASEIFFVFLL